MKDYQNKEIFESRVAFFKNKIFNYGGKSPFIIEKSKEDIQIKKLFSVFDHKMEKLDVVNLNPLNFKFICN